MSRRLQPQPHSLLRAPSLLLNDRDSNLPMTGTVTCNWDEDNDLTATWKKPTPLNGVQGSALGMQLDYSSSSTARRRQSGMDDRATPAKQGQHHSHQILRKKIYPCKSSVSCSQRRRRVEVRFSATFPVPCDHIVPAGIQRRVLRDQFHTTDTTPALRMQCTFRWR